MLCSRLKDVQNHEAPEATEEDGQLFRWGSLWAEAYSTVKNDPKYTKLLEKFEKYLLEAGNGMCFEERLRPRNFTMMKFLAHNRRS